MVQLYKKDLTILQMLDCQAIALFSTKQAVFPIVCVVLAPDSWNYCCGEQGPTFAIPPEEEGK